MTPQKSRRTGRPLKLASGAPMGECCCPTVPSGGGDCETCDPPLDTYYTVRLSGFSDNWSDFNGDWAVAWSSGCTWYGEWDVIGGSAVDLKITLAWDSVNEWWQVTLVLPGGCDYECHLASSDPCSTRPPGAYSQAFRDALCPSKSPDPIACQLI